MKRMSARHARAGRRVSAARADSPSAQVDRATLSGVVRDSGGGVVPGATVDGDQSGDQRRVAPADDRDRQLSGRST